MTFALDSNADTHRRTQRRALRGRKGLAHSLGLTPLALAALSSPDAKAWDPLHPDAACTGGGAHFSGPPRVVIHTAEMQGFDLAQTFQVLAAIVDIHEVVNAVAATSMEVTSTSLSTDPFTFKSWYGDTTPTIHVGFSSTLPAPGQGDGHAVAGACDYDEAHIGLWNESNYSWAYFEPEAEGVPFWDAGKLLGGQHSFRLAYLHELLHALGLAHSDHSFSVMNKDERPWHNRPLGEQFQPLADDVEALRELYPGAGGDSLRISLLNTWYDPTDLDGNGARQKMLCEPSTGNGWADRWDSSRLYSDAAPDDGLDTCGIPATGNGTDVCPGDVLWTRVAVSSYHTADVDIAMRLWFSPDDVWQGLPGGDVKADEVWEFTLGGQSSTQRGQTFTVPNLPEGDYYVIEKGVATASNGDKTNDWIPLRGKVHVKSANECPARGRPQVGHAEPICLFPPCGPEIDIEELPELGF